MSSVRRSAGPPAAPTLRQAVAALADNGEMVGVDAKAVRRLEALGQRSELGVRDLDDAETVRAHEMLVGVFGQMVGGSSLPEMDLLDQAALLRRGQRSVHRRLRNRRKAGLDPKHHTNSTSSAPPRQSTSDIYHVLPATERTENASRQNRCVSNQDTRGLRGTASWTR